MDVSDGKPDSRELALLQQFRAETGTPGIQLALRNSQGEITLWESGLADENRSLDLESTHRVQVGSATKMFTAALVLAYVEEGMLSLDDTLDGWYPDFPNSQAISIKDLLEHRSGLREVLSVPWILIPAGLRPGKIHKSGEILRRLSREKTTADPGERFEYSNTNYLLLGGILENISGQPVGLLMKERLFHPLGMTHTSLHPGQPMTETMAVDGIDRDYMPLGPHRISGEATSWITLAGPAGGVLSTAEDMMKWTVALNEGPMPSNFVRDHMREFQNDVSGLEDLGIIGYGQGLGQILLDGSLWIGHQGSIMGYECAPFYRDSDGVAIVVLLNQSRRQSPIPNWIPRLAEIIE